MLSLHFRQRGQERPQPPRTSTLALRDCHRTGGEQDHRRIAPDKRTSALDHYLEGVGLRATERLVGVSHNSVMNWVCEEVAGKVLAQVPARAVEWVEADELWTYVKKRRSVLVMVGY